MSSSLQRRWRLCGFSRVLRKMGRRPQRQQPRKRAPAALRDSLEARDKSGQAKATPRTADGHPDLSGFYNLGDIFAGDPVDEKPGQHVVVRSNDGSVFFDYGGANAGTEQVGTKILQTQNGKVNVLDRTCVNCEEPPYKPEYMAKAKAIGEAMHGDSSPEDPQYDCKPYGVPRGSVRGGGGFAMQIVQNADVVAFLYEDRPGPYFRIVYMNGQHPKDLDPSYYGHSIGHWEGDTLVVDVVGLNDETWLGSGTVGPKLAMMHSDQLHVVERWTRRGDVLSYEATVEDPVMFTKPWVMTPRQTQIAAAGDYIRPTMCVPFDKGHLVKEDNTPYISSSGGSGETSAEATAARGHGESPQCCGELERADLQQHRGSGEPEVGHQTGWDKIYGNGDGEERRAAARGEAGRRVSRSDRDGWAKEIQCSRHGRGQGHRRDHQDEPK